MKAKTIRFFLCQTDALKYWRIRQKKKHYKGKKTGENNFLPLATSFEKGPRTVATMRISDISETFRLWRSCVKKQSVWHTFYLGEQILDEPIRTP